MSTIMGVKLRIQKRENGKGHYYLEYYLGSKMVDGVQKVQRKREGLGLDLYLKPKNNKERDYNKNHKNLAEAILVKREYDFITSSHNLPNKNKSNKNFFEYINEFVESKNIEKKGKDAYTLTINYLEQYKGKNITIKEVDYTYCRDFLGFLLNTSKSNGEKLSTASVTQYFNKLRLIVKELHKEGLKETDLCKDIKNPKLDTKPRIFLTLDEVDLLVNTPYHLRNVKDLFLFSCFTGLRHSDILQLKWKDVREVDDNKYLTVKQQKTGQYQNVPLTENAIKVIGERKGDDDKIFEGAKYSANNNRHLEKWVLTAGIKKKVTFHTGRHTFATNHYSQFKDSKATGKWLGHQSSKSTEVYVHLANQTLFEQAKLLKQTKD